jgi:3-deoxy-manno-octulosonate cytidylyltransferase (CMP-KDO synthetase)
MSNLGVIPARYASTRLPAKPLADIGGKTMIQRVYEQAKLCPDLAKVIVATDDARIFDHVLSFGGEAMMTLPDHPSGTDRCAEVAEKLGGEFEVVLNIQGDEPFLNPIQLSEVVQMFALPDTQIATLGKKIETLAELLDEKEAKIAIDDTQRALYFSRSPIPYLKGVPQYEWLQHATFYKHIGLYGFRAEVLKQIPALPVSSIEKNESLEQLRWLSHFVVRVGFTDFETFAIDTPADLEEAKKYL